RAKVLFVMRERTIAVVHALPRRLRPHLEVHGECAALQLVADRRALDRPASELDHRRLAASQRRDCVLRLLGPELRLSLLSKDLGDSPPERSLEHAMDLEEATPESPRKPGTERRLPGTHEADQDEMAVQRVRG